LVELTVPVVLFFAPFVEEVTTTDTAHEPLAASGPPPLRLIEVAPPTGAKVPPQVLVEPGVPATCTPVGNVSLTATPESAVLLLGLVIVRVRRETPPI
jgi:hypothetical protein